jgi:hypothetical protein
LKAKTNKTLGSLSQQNRTFSSTKYQSRRFETQTMT